MEAARHWARGGKRDPVAQRQQFERDSKMFGIPVEQLEAAQRELEGDAPHEFEVWPDCADAVHWFIQCRTQWRMLPNAHGRNWFLGLEYSNVIAMLRANQVKLWREVFADIQVMEGAALELLNG